jgi:hypothetical protein
MDSKGMTYLKKYGLTNDEINKNYFWDSDGYLVFDGGSYQNARNFTGVGAKYMTRGVIRNNEPILQNTQSDSIIIVEDAISAIKVSRVLPSVPIHNSIIPTELLLRLSKTFSKLRIWLDPDRKRFSFLEAKKAELFFNDVKLIWSDKDPKYYSTSEIQNYIDKNN